MSTNNPAQPGDGPAPAEAHDSDTSSGRPRPEDVANADTTQGLRHSGFLNPVEPTVGPVSDPLKRADGKVYPKPVNKRISAAKGMGSKDGEAEEQPKKRKPPLTVLDFGRQRGFLFGMLLFIEIALLVLFRAVSQERFPWPEGFSANALIVIPFVQGIMAMAMARFAPRNVRGLLLLLVAVGPMLYAAANALAFEEVYLDVPLHWPINEPQFDALETPYEIETSIVRPVPGPAEQVDGLPLVPFWALAVACLMPCALVARLRTYFPRRKGLRIANLVGVVSVAGFFSLAVGLGYAGMLAEPDPLVVPQESQRLPDFLQQAPAPGGVDDTNEDEADNANQSGGILNPDDDDGIADGNEAAAQANQPTTAGANANDADAGASNNTRRGPAPLPLRLDEPADPAREFTPIAGENVIDRMLRFPAVAVLALLAVVALMHLLDLMAGGEKRGIAKATLFVIQIFGSALFVLWMFHACLAYLDTTWWSESAQYSDAVEDKGIARVLFHGALLFTLLLTSMALTGAAVADTVINNVIKPTGPARMPDGRTWEEHEAERVAREAAAAAAEVDANAIAEAAATPDAEPTDEAKEQT